MYVFPNTDIYFLTDVNLNNDYDHTIFFQTAAPPADPRSYQTTYFMGKRKFTLTNQSYQRKERGWLKVEIPQNSLWDCTYMMYRNTAYGDKWFYAFILSTEYVNDVTTLVNFEIDVIQTWFFDWTFDKCFIEREHSSSDEMFENTIEENIDYGNYINMQVIRNYNFSCDNLCALTTIDPTSVDLDIASDPNIYKGMLSGLYFMVGSVNNPTTFLANLKKFIQKGKEEAIVAIFQYPDLIGNPNQPYNETYGNGEGYGKYEYSFTSPNFVNVDGYIPKNKKLFIYPYNYLSVSDKEGQEREYKWEEWDNEHIGEFLIEGSIIGKPTVTIAPKYYREITIDRDNSISVDNFPTCTWSGDAYQIWLAQNGPHMYVEYTRNMVNILGDVASHLTPGEAFNQHTDIDLARGAVNRLFNVADMVANIITAKRIPNKAHGSTSNSVINIQNESKGFELKQMTIKSEYAKIIDEYFSKFGYASHRVKVPNLNARQNWTYTKTVGCEINGNIPSDDLTTIKRIFDHGVTFWTNGDNIGNYGDFSNPVYTP